VTARLEHQEATVVYDYPEGTVELYFTGRPAFLRAIKRNPHYQVAQDLNPGYRLVYSLDHCRAPESILKPAPGGEELLLSDWLTPLEIQNRNNAAARLKAVRADIADNS
jgi:hypothetical protein